MMTTYLTKVLTAAETAGWHVLYIDDGEEALAREPESDTWWTPTTAAEYAADAVEEAAILLRNPDLDVKAHLYIVDGAICDYNVRLDDIVRSVRHPRD